MAREKKGPGRPAADCKGKGGHGIHSSPRGAFVMPPAMAGALDRYCKKNKVRRSDAMRQALAEFLLDAGVYKP